MQKIGFEEAVEIVVSQDTRYEADAYVFLKDALEYTVRRLQQKKESGQHVSGEQLMNGFRDFALEELGPMVVTVMEEWGISCSEDVGEMVFNLIEAGVFGQSENDQRDDFAGVFDFHEAFVEPFLPSSKTTLSADK